MRDNPKQSIQGFVDKPTFAIYDRLIAEGKTDAEALEQINRESREHSRTPMQWDASAEAGFTTGTYRRKDEKNNILILTTSLADGITLPFTDTIEEVLLNNYDTCEAGEETIRLQPYQCLVLKVKE